MILQGGGREQTKKPTPTRAVGEEKVHTLSISYVGEG